MKKKRAYRKYDSSFKQEVLDQLKTGRSVQELSVSLGISPALIYQWKNRDSMSSSQEGEEVKQLRKKIKSLEKDNEILKKALMIFSRVP